MSTVAYRTPPIQPGVAPDANYLMRDLDLQFTKMVREQSQVSNWHTRFAWMPSQAFSSLRVDMPIDLSSFGFEDWTGIPTFKKGTNVKIRHEIAPFWSGTYINLKELEHPESAELIGAGVVGEGASYSYPFPVLPAGQSRSVPGKGLRENYLAFGYSNSDGADFQLDRIEVLVAQSKNRRV